MKTRDFLMVVIILITTNASWAIQEQQDHRILFEKAKYTMETKADFKEAITLFESLIKTYPDEKEYAAKAQFYVGLCFEKLGLKEARIAYQKVLDNYPDQEQEIALAKERLNRLLALQDVSPEPSFSKIRIPSYITSNARLSPDGRKLIHATVQDGKLWSIPLSGKLGTEISGVPIQLNTGDVPVENSALAWSGDGNWIAFNDCEYYTNEELEGMQGIHVIPADGGEPNEVIEVWRDVRIVSTGISLSPRGKMLAYSSVEDNQQHIFTKSTAGGESKQLVEAQAREPVFSPDGNMIAYVEDKNAGRAGGGLWTVSADGRAPKLVCDAEMASSPIWSPEGDRIAYFDREDENHIHIVPVSKDGEIKGDKITIDIPEGTGGIRNLAGWTVDNKIGLVLSSPMEFGLYTLPAKGGKAALVLHGGYPTQPRWSPDGKRIFHTNNKDVNSGDWAKYAIASIPAEGGQIKTVPIQSDIKILKEGWGEGNNVSPDGKMIAFTAQTDKDTSWHWQLYTVPVNGGVPKQLTHTPAWVIHGYPCWSPDGNSIAFVNTKADANYTKDETETNIFIIPATGGDPLPLTSESDSVDFSPIAWSPDGKYIAFYTEKEVNPDGLTLKIISVDGNETRELGTFEGIGIHNELAWSPDSKRVAFNGPEDIITAVSIKDGSIEEIKTGLLNVNIYHFDWSPDGERFVFAGYQGGDSEFWFMENFLPATE